MQILPFGAGLRAPKAALLLWRVPPRGAARGGGGRGGGGGGGRKSFHRGSGSDYLLCFSSLFAQELLQFYLKTHKEKRKKERKEEVILTYKSEERSLGRLENQ